MAASPQPLLTGHETEKECAIPPAMPTQQLSYCTEHANQELKSYCKKCEKLICMEYAIESVEDQNPAPLKKTSDQCKREIRASLQPMKKQLSVIIDALNQVDKLHEEISHQQEAIEGEIRKLARQLHDAVDTRTTDLINQLHNRTQTKLKSLSTQRDRIETIFQTYQHCETTVEKQLRTGSDQDIIRTEETMVGKIKSLTCSFRQHKLKPTTVANLQFTAGDTVRTYLKYGAISEVEVLPDPSKCFITSKNLGSLKVAEMASVSLQTFDHNGRLYSGDISSLECEFISEFTGIKPTVSINRRKKSLYELTFTPSIKGNHQLHIKINNQEVAGFPMTVLVRQPPEKIGIPISSIGGMKGPWGVAVSKMGEIIVTEHGKHCVSVFSPRGTKIRSFGSRGSEEGQLNEPHGVAVDRNGDILVVDSKNNRIQKFMASGKFLTAVGSRGSGHSQFRNPQDLTFNAFNQKVYVVDIGNNRIQILDSDLTFLTALDCRYPGIGKNITFYNPCGITCDASGQLYVADCRSSQILILTAEGKFLQMTLFAESAMKNRKTGPVSMALSGDSTLYISDHHSHQLSMILPGQGSCPTSIVNGKGNSPRGLAVDNGGVLYVCDYDKDCVIML